MPFSQAGASYVFTSTLVAALTVTLSPAGGIPASSHFEGSGSLEHNGLGRPGAFTFAFASTDNAGTAAAQLTLTYGELGNLMI